MGKNTLFHGRTLTTKPHTHKPLKISVSGMPEGYMGHPQGDSFTVSMPDGNGFAFLRRRGAIKKFHGEQAMISYCQKHAERGLTSDQEI